MSDTDFATFLRDRRDAIVARFVAEVQRGAMSPEGTARALLVDHIPSFLEEIAQELAAQDAVRRSQDRIDTSETARQHGEQRWSLGYDLNALIREYGVLRHCIVEEAKEARAQPSLDEHDVLAKCLSVGVAEAAAAYTRHRDEQFTAERSDLEFLAQAGQVLSSSLDYRATLGRLTQLLVPRMADWCAVYVEGLSAAEMPIAHVDPTKLEILRDLYRRFPLAADSAGGHLHMVRTGEPHLVPEVVPGTFEAMATSAEHLAMLRAIDTRSWMVLPLRVQDSPFGALVLGTSSSKRHYAEHDLVVGADVARRAAVAIDNARLYALSQQERSRVEAATRAKDEFVAMVSHELRTPLHAMLGWLRLMRSDGFPDDKRAHALDVIERNAGAQNQLVGDLLDISRVMTGQFRVNLSQVDLRNVIELAIEGVRPAAEAKRISLHVDAGGESALMRGDADRLQQVMWNVLTNAVKFTPRGGRVEVRLRRVASDLVMTVTDTGEGIAPPFLPHVFESFRQSDTSATRTHGGLGIGLSIAKHIVELHGGVISAQSEGKSQGSTFVVTLPISPVVSTTLGVARVPASVQPSGATPLPKGLEHLRIVVVDDDPDARELVAFVLESSGAEIRAAESAAAALAALEVFDAHVIVSDIGMPGEDGYALIRAIRTSRTEAKRSIPAIALTAFARNEDRTRALIEGFNLHMSKPVEAGALVKAVLELVGPARRGEPAAS